MSALERAAAFVGVPYIAPGGDLNGWDCRGCVRYCREALFSLPSPGLDSVVYSRQDARDIDEVERLVRANMAAWRPVTPRPGAVLLFSIYQREAHVGLFLGAGEFIHALAGAGTVIAPLRGAWARRLRGAYDTVD